MTKYATGEDLVNVEIDKVVAFKDRSVAIQKDKEIYHIGNSVVDNLDDLHAERERKEESKVIVIPKWLAHKNEWPEGDD